MTDKQKWWFEWYYARYYQPHNFRFPSFWSAMLMLWQISDYNRIIVETGCQRAKPDLGSGESTFIFANFCKNFGGKLITVDNNDEYLRTARRIASDCFGYVEFVLDDSISFLSGFDDEINLLYLDSCDYDVNNPLFSQEHSLKEIEAGFNKMANPAIVLLDDINFGDFGKGALSRQYLIEHGCLELYLHQQSIFLKEKMSE